MEKKLDKKRIAILATDGFEQSELQKPMEALKAEGALPRIVSLKSGKIKGWNEKNWGDEIEVDITVDRADSNEFDALLLPGGVMNPDKLRQDEKAVQFVREFFDSGKPIAAICHGPWLLAEADIVNGRTLTSYDSIKTDLTNAGAIWIDQEVVVDNGLVTSRAPKDIPAFNKKMIEEFAEGKHERENSF